MDKYIRDFIQYISLERRYSQNTAESYTLDLRQFEEFLKDVLGWKQIDWSSIAKKDVRYYLAFLNDQHLSQRSIARKLTSLKSFYRFLIRQDIITTNPLASVKIPRFEKKIPEFLSADEVKQMLSLPQLRTFEGLRDLTILELFYGTGMRLSELLNLKLSNLLLDENLIRLRGKGDKERVVPVGSVSKKILQQYLEIRSQYAAKNVENVFVLRSGKPMYPMAIQRIVKKYMTPVSSTRHQSPHILRHTYATHLLNAGASIRVVKDLLGHESLSTTQIYTHMSIEHLKNVYKAAHPGAADKSPINRRRS